VSKAVFTGHKGLESRPAVISVFAKQSHNSAGGAEAPDAQRARVLLTSVFGPYARDDKFGSRAINPMELYHNQVTRAQGAFSLRMFHRSWGIMMIQANITAPSTLMDLPSCEKFTRELVPHITTLWEFRRSS